MAGKSKLADSGARSKAAYSAQQSKQKRTSPDYEGFLAFLEATERRWIRMWRQCRTFEELRKLALKRADNIDSWNGGSRSVKIFSWHLDESMSAVAELVKAALTKRRLSVPAFLRYCLLGSEHLARARAVQAADQKAWNDGLLDSEDDFVPDTQRFFQFPSAVLSAVDFVRLKVFPSAEIAQLLIHPKPDARFEAWRDTAIKRLRDHVLPRIPPWLINNDIFDPHGLSEQNVVIEWERLVDAGITAESQPDIAPLTELQQEVFDYIRDNGPVRGKAICNALSIPSESSFTRHYVPALKSHGVKNRRGSGYYLPGSSS